MVEHILRGQQSFIHQLAGSYLNCMMSRKLCEPVCDQLVYRINNVRGHAVYDKTHKGFPAAFGDGTQESFIEQTFPKKVHFHRDNCILTKNTHP